jgi:hypothetical protein
VPHPSYFEGWDCTVVSPVGFSTVGEHISTDNCTAVFPVQVNRAKSKQGGSRRPAF